MKNECRCTPYLVVPAQKHWQAVAGARSEHGKSSVVRVTEGFKAASKDLRDLQHQFNYQTFDLSWPSGAIWHHRSWSTLVQVVACCLMAPSHYLNQCWLSTSDVFWQSQEVNFTGNAEDIYPWYEFKNWLHCLYLRLQPHLPGANGLMATLFPDICITNSVMYH